MSDWNNLGVAGVSGSGFIRDPSGLLMSIIRTLSASDGDHQRNVERGRLKEAFEETDEKLDTLISQNYEEVAMTIKRFSKISERIADSRVRMKRVRENLQQCKSLLYCRQDELRKLWVEGVEHNRVLSLLDQIEKVKKVPYQVDSYLRRKHYLHATVLINKTLYTLNNQLSNVEAFNDIRNEIMSKKIHLHEGFIDEINQLIYFKSFIASKHTKSKLNLIQLSSFDLSMQDSNQDIGTYDKIVTELEDIESKPDENNPKQLINILVESLNRLGRVPEMIDQLKFKMDRHINMIVSHSTVEVTDQFFNTDGSSKIDNIDGSKRLLELLNKLFNKFKIIADAHSHILAQVNALICTGRMQPIGNIYEMDNVWSKIQSVLQVLLNEYLDAENVQATQEHATLNETKYFSSHFTRVKNQQQTNSVKLFKFDRSSHAISMNNFLREQRTQQRSNFIEGNGTSTSSSLIEHAMNIRVCQPNAKNITLIFSPLKSFILEIETLLSYNKGRRCSLHEYITDYIQDIFIRHIQYSLKKDFDNAMKVTDPLKIMAEPAVLLKLKTDKNLVHGATVADECLWYLYDLTCSLDSYHDHFLTMACSLTQEYKEICVQSFRGIVQPEPEVQMLSSDWLNQINLKEEFQKLDSWKSVNGLTKEKTEKSLESGFTKEALFFIQKLETSDVKHYKLLSDIENLQRVASLHESVEWMSSRVTKFAKKVNKQVCADTKALLTKLSSDFLSLSENCLLTLHIEVRLNCCQKIKQLFKVCISYLLN